MAKTVNERINEALRRSRGITIGKHEQTETAKGMNDWIRSQARGPQNKERKEANGDSNQD